MDKEYIIYTRRLAAELREQGFKFLRLGVNKNFPQFNTYIFENSKELQLAIKAASNKK